MNATHEETLEAAGLDKMLARAIAANPEQQLQVTTERQAEEIARAGIQAQNRDEGFMTTSEYFGETKSESAYEKMKSKTPPLAQGDLYFLQNAVEHNERMIEEIPFKEPTFGDFMDCGELFSNLVQQSPTGEPIVEVRVNPQALVAWWRRLTGFEISVMRKMSKEDGAAVFKKLQNIVGAGTLAPQL